jgi:hypothetical protein
LSRVFGPLGERRRVHSGWEGETTEAVGGLEKFILCNTGTNAMRSGTRYKTRSLILGSSVTIALVFVFPKNKFIGTHGLKLQKNPALRHYKFTENLSPVFAMPRKMPLLTPGSAGDILKKVRY